MKTLLAMTAALLLFSALPLQAQDTVKQDDGNELLRRCTQVLRGQDGDTLNPVQGGDGMYCLGFIGAVLDTHSIVVTLREIPPLFCLPEDGIKTGQAVRIVVKWARENPKELHINEGLVTLAALANAYPCEEK